MSDEAPQNDPDLCDLVRRALAAGTEASSGALDQALITHLAACESCCGLAQVTAAAAPDALARLLASQCAIYEDDLPAYISVEIDSGPREAAVAYPHVWLHLLICERCAEQHRLVHSLYQAELAGRIPEAPRAAPARRTASSWRTLLDLSRATLQLILAPASPALGAMRGSSAHPLVLADEELDGRYVMLSVMRTSDDSWSAQVTVDPPLPGTVALRLGERRFAARLGADGTTAIEGIPDSLLVSEHGPDLRLAIAD